MTSRVSIVMATYDGAAHVAKQLETIAAQDVAPFELVVFDDNSKDGTAAIVEDFARRCPFAVRLTRNKRRVGVGANFSAALSCARGDIVVLSDQDDVWAPSKLETLVRCFDTPSVVAAASDARLIDAHGVHVESSLWSRTGFIGPERRQFDTDPLSSLLRTNHIPGATAAFRASVLSASLPIPARAIHDWWILLIASCVGSIVLVEHPLIGYRQHEANAIGADAMSTVAAWRQRRRRLRAPIWSEEAMFCALASHPAVPPDRRSEVEAKLALVELRTSLGRSLPRRLIQVAPPLLRGDYARFARGYRSALVDVLDPMSVSGSDIAMSTVRDP